MPVIIKSNSGGGSVTLDAGAASLDTTLVLPNTNGSVLVAPGGILPVTAGGTGAATLTANAVLIGNGTSAVTAVAPSTAGNVLTSTGSAWASTAPSSPVPTPSAIGQIPFSTDGSTYTATQKIVRGTAVASTSGTAIDFTSIPSWVKRVTVQFSGVSTSGASLPQVQLGPSGGPETSGYLGAATGGGAGIGTSAYASGFLLNSNASSSAATIRHGSIIFTNVSSNLWVAQGVISLSDTAVAYYTAGSKSLAGALTQVRITTVNGTDTFDAGSINIMYE